MDGMSSNQHFAYLRGPWPEEPLPTDAPAWLYYEVDSEADAVVRTVEVFTDGRIARNSLAIERRNGADCPSLIDVPLDEAFADTGHPLEQITAEEFDVLWLKGVDTPFWDRS